MMVEEAFLVLKVSESLNRWEEDSFPARFDWWSEKERDWVSFFQGDMTEIESNILLRVPCTIQYQQEGVDFRVGLSVGLRVFLHRFASTNAHLYNSTSSRHTLVK
ncbi:hypothetical protein J6590_097001 [Homalodisca vitripennis]|nr:hypothetical protein J6590_097001 [Homalodisca vitripennis]